MEHLESIAFLRLSLAPTTTGERCWMAFWEEFVSLSHSMLFLESHTFLEPMVGWEIHRLVQKSDYGPQQHIGFGALLMTKEI